MAHLIQSLHDHINVMRKALTRLIYFKKGTLFLSSFFFILCLFSQISAFYFYDYLSPYLNQFNCLKNESLYINDYSQGDFLEFDESDLLGDSVFYKWTQADDFDIVYFKGDIQHYGVPFYQGRYSKIKNIVSPDSKFLINNKYFQKYFDNMLAEDMFVTIEDQRYEVDQVIEMKTPQFGRPQDSFNTDDLVFPTVYIYKDDLNFLNSSHAIYQKGQYNFNILSKYLVNNELSGDYGFGTGKSIKKEWKKNIKFHIDVSVVSVAIPLFYLTISMFACYNYLSKKQLSEIAIRLICGQSKHSIFNVLLAEYLIIALMSLLFATVISALISIILLSFNAVLCLITSALIVIVILSASALELMIQIRKGYKNPKEALQYE